MRWPVAGRVALMRRAPLAKAANARPGEACGVESLVHASARLLSLQVIGESLISRCENAVQLVAGDLVGFITKMADQLRAVVFRQHVLDLFAAKRRDDLQD